MWCPNCGRDTDRWSTSRRDGYCIKTCVIYRKKTYSCDLCSNSFSYRCGDAGHVRSHVLGCLRQQSISPLEIECNSESADKHDQEEGIVDNPAIEVNYCRECGSGFVGENSAVDTPSGPGDDNQFFFDA